MERRTVDVAFSIGGAVFSVLLLVLGLVLKDQADFAESYVHDQLDEQKISFTPVDRLASEEEFQATLMEKLGSQEAVDAFIEEFGLTSEANSGAGTRHKIRPSRRSASTIVFEGYSESSK